MIQSFQQEILEIKLKQLSAINGHFEANPGVVYELDDGIDLFGDPVDSISVDGVVLGEAGEVEFTSLPVDGLEIIIKAINVESLLMEAEAGT